MRNFAGTTGQELSRPSPSLRGRSTGRAGHLVHWIECAVAPECVMRVCSIASARYHRKIIFPSAPDTSTPSVRSFAILPAIEVPFALPEDVRGAKTSANSDQASWLGDSGRAKRNLPRPTTTRMFSILRIIQAQTMLVLKRPRTTQGMFNVLRTRQRGSCLRASTCA